jgi:hypothetical protein
MKKVFLLLVAAAFTLLSANAQTENDLVISAGDAKEIVLGDDMYVVLVSATSQQENIRLNKATLQKMDVKFYDGTLEVMPRKDLRNETVYLIVSDMKLVTLGFNTSVRSEGILQSSRIDVYINQGATARIKTSGKIQGYSLGDFEVKIISKPIFSGSSASIN